MHATTKKAPPNRQLELNHTQVADAGLEHLKGLASLQNLDLSDTQVTDAGVKDLAAALPRCRIVWQDAM